MASVATNWKPAVKTMKVSVGATRHAGVWGMNVSTDRKHNRNYVLSKNPYVLGSPLNMVPERPKSVYVSNRRQRHDAALLDATLKLQKNRGLPTVGVISAELTKDQRRKTYRDVLGAKKRRRPKPRP